MTEDYLSEKKSKRVWTTSIACPITALTLENARLFRLHHKYMVRVKAFTKGNQDRERNKRIVRKSNNVFFLLTKLFSYLKIAIHNLA